MDRDVANAIQIAGRAIGDGIKQAGQAIGEGLKTYAMVVAVDKGVTPAQVLDWSAETKRSQRHR